MHFARYEEAPRAVAEEIVAKVQGKTADEVEVQCAGQPVE